jgi:hypothetical protein
MTAVTFSVVVVVAVVARDHGTREAARASVIAGDCPSPGAASIMRRWTSPRDA